MASRRLQYINPSRIICICISNSFTQFNQTCDNKNTCPMQFTVWYYLSILLYEKYQRLKCSCVHSFLILRYFQQYWINNEWTIALFVHTLANFRVPKYLAELKIKQLDCMPECLISSLKVNTAQSQNNKQYVAVRILNDSSIIYTQASWQPEDEGLCVFGQRKWTLTGSGRLLTRKGLAEYFIHLILQQSHHSTLEAISQDQIRE